MHASRIQPQESDWTQNPLPDPANYPVGHTLVLAASGYSWVYERREGGWRFVSRLPDGDTTSSTV